MNYGQQTSGGDILAQVQKWLAIVVGGLAVFFLTPVLYAASEVSIQQFTFSHYGEGMVWFATLVWWVVLAAVIFSIACGVTIATVRIIFAKLFARFF